MVLVPMGEEARIVGVAQRRKVVVHACHPCPCVVNMVVGGGSQPGPQNRLALFSEQMEVFLDQNVRDLTC